MKTSKLLMAIQTLSKEEWPSLKKYILNQTNEKSDPFNLFMALQSKKGEAIDVSHFEKIKAKYFSSINQKSFLNLQSKLYLWFEEWMVIEELKQDRFQSSLLLVKALNRRSLYKHANQVAEKLENNIQSQKLNIENSRTIAQLKHYQYFSNNPIKYKGDINMLQDLIENHLNYFLEQNTLYKRELDNWGKIKKHDYSHYISTLEKIESHIKPTEVSMIGSLLYKTATTNEVKSFLDLKKILINDKKVESHSEFITLITLYLIRDAFRLYQLREISNKKIFIDLYSEAFENGTLFNHGKISTMAFHNNIDALSAILNHAEIIELINNWIDKVSYNDRISTLNLALAQSAFKNELYGNMISLLRDFTHLTPAQKRRAMGLSLIAHYHERHEDYDTFINTLNNFKRYIKRHKKDLAKKTYHHNMILIESIEQLAKLDFSNQKSIIEYKGVIYRDWVEKEILKQKANLGID